MPVWLIEPAAAPEDGRWQGRTIWRAVVCAPTPAEARLVAEHWALGGRDPETINENLEAGFGDEKLYWVQRAPDDLVASIDVSSSGNRVLSAARLS